MDWKPQPSQDPEVQLFTRDGVELKVRSHDSSYSAVITVDGADYYFEEPIEVQKHYASVDAILADATRIADAFKRAQTKIQSHHFAQHTDLQHARYLYELYKRGNPAEIVMYLWANDSNGAYDSLLMNRDHAIEAMEYNLKEYLSNSGLTMDQVEKAPSVFLPNPLPDNDLKKRLLT